MAKKEQTYLAVALFIVLAGIGVFAWIWTSFTVTNVEDIPGGQRISVRKGNKLLVMAFMFDPEARPQVWIEEMQGLEWEGFEHAKNIVIIIDKDTGRKGRYNWEKKKFV